MPRPGFITASVFNSCMTKSFGKTVEKECCRIACERLGVKWLDEQFDLGGIRTIEWGIENESLAIRAYEAETFNTVHSQQVFHRIQGTMVGGTPDGLIGEDGGIEVKCPNSDNHLLHITSDRNGYIHQVQAYLWITGRKWWDFISYDPRFPEDLQLHIQRIERDEDMISDICQRAAEMEAYITDVIRKARPSLSLNGQELVGIE